MSRFLLRTGLNSTRLLFSRLQLNCAPSNAALAVVAPSPPPPPAKSQSAWMHHGAYESMLKSAKLFPLSLELSTKSDDNSSGSSLEKKAIEIQSTRNSNPFNIYFKEKYKQTAQSNPKATNKEVFSMLATSWRSLKMDEKLKYVEAAKENQRKTKSELEKFYSSMSTEEANSVMQTLKQKRSERRKELSKIRIKREQRSMNKPKPPPGAFFLYCKSLDRGEANIKEFIKGASMKWKALAQQDKQKYVDENKALVDEYQQKLKDWETRMVSEGRVKLVRAKFRQTLEKKLRKPSGPKTGARGLKLARKLKLKKLRAQARRARQARVAREKRERAKKALKARQAKMELNKARKLVELATKIKLSALKKTLDDSTTVKKKKTSGSDRKAAPKPPKFKDDEIVSHEKPDKTN